MAQKKRHVLNIFSQEISLFSSDSDQHMAKLAEFVNDRMNNFNSEISRISFGDLSLLTSLSIADDYFKTKEKFANFEKNKAKLEDDLSEALSKIMNLEAIAREKEFKIENLEEKLQNLDSSLNTKIESNESLINKLNVLSYELKKPLEERNYKSTLKEAYDMLESE